MIIRFSINRELPNGTRLRAELRRLAIRHGLRVVTRGRADVIVSVGGDGTLLRTVREFPSSPVVGFNLGGLGYLSSVGRDELDDAMGKLATRRFRISARTMLEGDGRFTALNDIVVVREQSGRSARLDLSADGRLVARYMADGLIFSTPTGSTAYSLAAGGPVVMPDLQGIVVTAMNPHALGVRPLVVSDRARFTVTVRPRTAGNVMKTGVYADGEHVMTLAAGKSVTIERSRQTAKIVELEGYDPYGVLARKLGWSGSNVR